MDLMTRIRMHISKAKLPFYPPSEVKCELQNEMSIECPSLTELEKWTSMYEKDTWLCNQYLTVVNTDKNADRHVVDQNVDRILREIAYVPLGERIRSKCSSNMQLFFFFLVQGEGKKWVQDMLTSGHDKIRILVMI